uniref:Uncharacterized protein n=1 Tax=Alexandrium andersonii TaxID=327968 RepID=A0A7S2DYS5_9DINO
MQPAEGALSGPNACPTEVPANTTAAAVVTVPPLPTLPPIAMSTAAPAVNTSGNASAMNCTKGICMPIDGKKAGGGFPWWAILLIVLVIVLVGAAVIYGNCDEKRKKKKKAKKDKKIAREAEEVAAAAEVGESQSLVRAEAPPPVAAVAPQLSVSPLAAPVATTSGSYIMQPQQQVVYNAQGQAVALPPPVQAQSIQMPLLSGGARQPQFR